ncbi:MAG: thiamine pyrophosphate-binding protein, partial [Planctomycetes bacterium]|nr:thiamine pyrophosphate-binding protein [Planctomycetota bacterium]
MTVHRGTQANGTMTVYQAIASDIKGMGIYIVFGLMSDDICPLIATLDAMGIEFCSARHENNGIMMAVGYAAASRKLGVAMVGRGPAMANAMHGIMAASRSGQRVLVITGDAPASSHTANRPGPDIKHYAASAVLGAAGIRTFHAGTPGSARDALAEASAYASAGQTGVLLIPTDILMGEVNVSRSGPEKPLRAQLSPPLPQQPSLDLALQLIDRSRTPLIIGGYGAYNAGAKEALQALAERTGALLATTLKGKDLFHGHPADIGIVGSSSTSLARACIEGSDCILAFGASLNSLTTNSGSALPPVPIIHIDTDRKNIGRWHRADVAIAGDAKAVAEELLARASARPADRKPHHSAELLQRIRNFSHESDFASASTQRTCDPRTLALKLDQMLPVDRHVIYDGGNFMAVWAYISVAHPGRFTHTLDFGSIGLSLGA